MSFEFSYGLLFEVTLLHNYFLNNAEETYESMSPTDKEKMIQKYSIDSFISITPTTETASIIRNHKLLFKKTKTGFCVHVKVKETDETDPFISIPLTKKLDFLIRINDYQFENYTDIEFVLNQIFLFTNIKPTTETNPFSYISKSDETELISNDYLASEETTTDLISLLQTEENRNIFGIISLTMQGDDAPNNILDNSGKLLNPVFKIHFDNRKTIWKYINRKDATEVETNSSKPLTYSGFVEIDPLTDFTPAEPEENQYPNPSVKSIVKINSDYYSEIFI